MTLKRSLVCTLVTVFLLAAPAVPAQETDTQTAPEAATADDTEQGPGFWGDRFALYLETWFGAASSDPISTTVFTQDSVGSINRVTLDDQEAARIVGGWELPEDRGKFLVIWNGLKETEWSFSGSGLRTQVSGTQLQSPAPVPWWNLRVDNGILTADGATPTWLGVVAQGQFDPTSGCDQDNDGDGQPDIIDPRDDTNCNGAIELDEVRFVPNSNNQRPVVETLENQLQTLDAMYFRPFGGRKINATWGAGVRYFVYDGNLPVGAWLSNVTTTTTALGYTEGSNLRLMSFSQEASGIGPTGAAELRLNFLRERLVLYWIARASFLISDLDADSGRFIVLVRNDTTQAILPVEARLQESRSKDTWHTGAEGGVRVRLAEGLTLHLSYFLDAFQDAVLAPSRLAVPEGQAQAVQGVSALYRTRDIRVDGWRGGFSFQF